ncbi:hypothetical protein HW452_05305 [Halomonas aquamarina]|uniref:Uncharacterized protein n=1 Tax=Vreelandella aquamarina TaxID=77097 RepID=A0ACC5VTT9_9GAMM|nr:hypothetical protein [Halomonas aquamarina]MBZ5486939.1 hypothetical protein [Halomonas aquamarina]
MSKMSREAIQNSLDETVATVNKITSAPGNYSEETVELARCVGRLRTIMNDLNQRVIELEDRG